MKSICSAILLFGFFYSIWADEPAALPPAAFPAEHYQPLWTKSPFAVASPEAAQESAEYSLVGAARFDGIDYASLINKQTNEHLLLTSVKALPGLSLVSLTHGTSPSGTFAIILNHGQTLTLKLETAVTPPSGNPATAANQPPPPNAPFNQPRAINYPQQNHRPPVSRPHTIIPIPSQPPPQ